MHCMAHIVKHRILRNQIELTGMKIGSLLGEATGAYCASKLFKLTVLCLQPYEEQPSCLVGTS